jgi:hypothetical protein
MKDVSLQVQESEMSAVPSHHCMIVSIDLTSNRTERLNMVFFETSALDRGVVDEAFMALTRQVKDRLQAQKR